jgi:holin-like protein
MDPSRLTPLHRNKVLQLAIGASVLLALRSLSHWIVDATALPVPPAALGLMILFALLVLVQRVPAALETIASPLLGHMNLFFIPASVGVIALGGVLAGDGVGLLAAMLVSTGVGLVFCAKLLVRLRRVDSTDGS